MSVSPEARIACDVAFFFVPAAVVTVRFYLRIIKQYHRRWTRAAIFGEVFIAVMLSAATSVVFGDIWTHVRVIQLRGPDTPGLLAARRDQDIAYFKLAFYNQFAWISLMWCIKAAFICIYIDMATHLPNGIRRIIRFVSYILVLSWVVSNLVFLCWCLPFERNWKLDRNLCSSQTSKFAISFVSCQHLVTDCMVLVLPVLILRQLHLQKTEKWAVGIIFVLGLFTVGAGTVGYALRLQAQIHVAQRRTGTGPAAAMIAEFKNRMAVVHLVSTAEAACAIVVLCLPSMRVLLTKSRSMRRKIVGSNLRGRVMRKDTLEIIDSSSGFEPAAVAPTLQAIQMQDVEANRAPSGRQFCREDAYRVRKDFEWDTVLTPPSRESVGELGNS